ncbi:hypothetical protein AMATHDRAFT_7558 [Amanita thiersii Skay4041]|uniref:Uncharacterized protein n=1 Tax=Amanita thiersii Skay4041 TaxID=703135 RepID=A0A2A9NEG4_9AGAR|nr:hypothetical protein AMATHDRAFT_7558 [Amanita thiersii Skay4041]
MSESTASTTNSKMKPPPKLLVKLMRVFNIDPCQCPVAAQEKDAATPPALNLASDSATTPHSEDHVTLIAVNQACATATKTQVEPEFHDAVECPPEDVTSNELEVHTNLTGTATEFFHNSKNTTIQKAVITNINGGQYNLNNVYVVQPPAPC